jgi:hypothetical protein
MNAHDARAVRRYAATSHARVARWKRETIEWSAARTGRVVVAKEEHKVTLYVNGEVHRDATRAQVQLGGRQDPVRRRRNARKAATGDSGKRGGATIYKGAPARLSNALDKREFRRHGAQARSRPAPRLAASSRFMAKAAAARTGPRAASRSGTATSTN